MDNTRKLDLIARLERRAKLKKILLWGVLALFLGAVLLYAQFRHAAG